MAKGTGLTEAQAPILQHHHIARCSDSLRRDTATVEAWGRQRWPDARVMHELQVGGCRLDMAFVRPAHIIGVEIKSERNTLDRLKTQLRHYTAEIPEVWIAYAPKWAKPLSRYAEDAVVPWQVGHILVDEAGVEEMFPVGPLLAPRGASPRLMLTAPMLHLLWRSEIGGLARQHGIRLPARVTLPNALPILARKLTGDQIVEGVCAALRAREKTGGFAADPAIPSPTSPGAQEDRSDG